MRLLGVNAVLTLDGRPRVRIDVEPVEVAFDVRQRQQALVHDPEPQWRHVSQKIHTEIAVRQRRQIREVPERLVAPERVGVVIRVPLEMKQHEIAQNVIAVPRMMRPATLEFAVGVAPAEQSVVLDVVGTRELPIGEGVVNQQEQQHERTERDNQRDRNRSAQTEGLQYLIVGVPRAFAATQESFTLVLPRACKSTGNLPQCKTCRCSRPCVRWPDPPGLRRRGDVRGCVRC